MQRQKCGNKIWEAGGPSKSTSLQKERVGPDDKDAQRFSKQTMCRIPLSNDMSLLLATGRYLFHFISRWPSWPQSEKSLLALVAAPGSDMISYQSALNRPVTCMRHQTRNRPGHAFLDVRMEHRDQCSCYFPRSWCLMNLGLV